jgi:ribosomal protein S18 acetylase RimI-like enzyme
VEFAENICRKTGIWVLRLEVEEKNKAAQSLYDSLGFKRDARYMYTKKM